MRADKNTVLCLLEILKDYSDSEHILGMKEIQSLLHITYDLSPDRRTIYAAIDALIHMGWDISTFEENKSGYYLRSRVFEPAEIRLLCDAVHAFPFVPARQSETLIKKLGLLLSKHQRAGFKHLHLVHTDRRTDNRQVFLNIELLSEAIACKRQVCFTYMQYGMDKKLHPRRERPYTVHPHSMVYTNERYYLVCRSADHPNMSMYRIDLMREVSITDMRAEVSEDAQTAAQNALYAFAGKPERITLHCDRCILGDVLDRFGTDVWLADVDEARFSASFTAPPMGVKFWALQYLPYVEVIEPKWLRDAVVESVKSNPYSVS